MSTYAHCMVVQRFVPHHNPSEESYTLFRYQIGDQKWHLVNIKRARLFKKKITFNFIDPSIISFSNNENKKNAVSVLSRSAEVKQKRGWKHYTASIKKERRQWEGRKEEEKRLKLGDTSDWLPFKWEGLAVCLRCSNCQLWLMLRQAVTPGETELLAPSLFRLPVEPWQWETASLGLCQSQKRPQQRVFKAAIAAVAAVNDSRSPASIYCIRLTVDFSLPPNTVHPPSQPEK